MDRIFSRMAEMEARHPLAGQIARFGLSGGSLAFATVAGYWAIADLLHVDANLSFLIVFLIGTAIGYMLHSRYSFRGHGTRDARTAHIRTTRFFIVNILAFFLNQAFVWFFVKYLGGPTWWPIPAMILITPILTFLLNRYWVFR